MGGEILGFSRIYFGLTVESQGALGSMGDFSSLERHVASGMPGLCCSRSSTTTPSGLTLNQVQWIVLSVGIHLVGVTKKNNVE